MHHLANPMQRPGGAHNQVLIQHTGLGEAMTGLKNLMSEYEDVGITTLTELKCKYSIEELSNKIYQALKKKNANAFFQLTGVLQTELEKANKKS